ncbi:MAG: DUF4041 domain-containing protein [Reichenbachiella sp.]
MKRFGLILIILSICQVSMAQFDKSYVAKFNIDYKTWGKGDETKVVGRSKELYIIDLGEGAVETINRNALSFSKKTIRKNQDLYSVLDSQYQEALRIERLALYKQKEERERQNVREERVKFKADSTELAEEELSKENLSRGAAEKQLVERSLSQKNKQKVIPSKKYSPKIVIKEIDESVQEATVSEVAFESASLVEVKRSKVIHWMASIGILILTISVISIFNYSKQKKLLKKIKESEEAFIRLRNSEQALVHKLKDQSTFHKNELVKKGKQIHVLSSELKIYEPIKDVKYEVERINTQIIDLESQYQNGLVTFKNLKDQTKPYEEKFELIEHGLFEPQYEFDRSEDYKEELKAIVDKQKLMVKEGRAAMCSTNWTIDGDQRAGARATKKFIKLMLRAYNGECDALVSKVKWYNFDPSINRIENAFDQINKLGHENLTSISIDYLELKKKQLVLEYEYQLKQKSEKEKLRDIKEREREEERAVKEYEKAQKQAREEEEMYQRALELAKRELETETGDKNMLESKILNLEKQLNDALERKERALSMAQQTKRGHVYVISNIGSFGEGVFKIGLTRRLEPTDRVQELGGASVPFRFDTHAMIFSEDAPALEKNLHQIFESNRVNMVNGRKEFFNVKLEEIQKKVVENGVEAEFIKLPEAPEYRETLAILKHNEKVGKGTAEVKDALEEFPLKLVS